MTPGQQIRHSNLSEKEPEMVNEVRIYQELPEWLVEAVRPPGDPRTFEQALAQLIGKNAQLLAENERLRTLAADEAIRP